MKRCIHCLVSGRVQGVCFRAAARSRALELGVTGWARNLDDGRVEVRVYGDGESVQVFRDWLDEGPSAARVERVEASEEAREEAREEIYDSEPDSFEVR